MKNNFAFIEFEEPEDAESAIFNYNNTEILGNLQFSNANLFYIFSIYFS